MIRYLLLFLFSIFASQSWYALAAVPTHIYDYDASLSYSIDQNTESEDQNSNYGDTSNFRYCCNEVLNSDFQEKALGESFFAFIDGLLVTKGANSSVNGVKLQKQLASQEQLGQLSKGGGTVISQPAKQADRIAAQTGRNPANIQKVSSDAKVMKDGQQIQTHSFRDASTNELIEPKTIIDN